MSTLAASPSRNIEVHLRAARRQARRRLADAAPPVRVTGTQLAFAAFALFVVATGVGFAVRVWQFASI
jgi:hypothetical protein